MKQTLIYERFKMETFGIIGFSFGSMAFTFAIIGWAQIANLQKEVTELKKDLVAAGVKLRSSDKTD